jgi:hypothetical protein
VKLAADSAKEDPRVNCEINSWETFEHRRKQSEPFGFCGSAHIHLQSGGVLIVGVEGTIQLNSLRDESLKEVDRWWLIRFAPLVPIDIPQDPQSGNVGIEKKLNHVCTEIFYEKARPVGLFDDNQRRLT